MQLIRSNDSIWNNRNLPPNATQKVTTLFQTRFNGLTIRKPLYATLLTNRKITWALVVVAALQITLAAFELPGWKCPIKTALGIPCPGCGLSRASVLLLKGEWLQAVQYHFFAPLVLFGFGLMLVITLLPAASHAIVVQRIAQFEKKTGLTAVLLIVMLLYGLFRLL